jgi:hypothetical protein
MMRYGWQHFETAYVFEDSVYESLIISAQRGEIVLPTNGLAPGELPP